MCVFQLYRNESATPIEAKYIFPLDERAAVCGFEAFVNGKHVLGQLKEKEQAKKEYKEATKDHGQFADLDDYLRQGADKLAVRKTKEKEKFMRKRLQQLAQADGSDAEDEDGNAVDDSEVKNLYRGQVLLACEDNIHAFEAKSILEEAFFDVHLARDGRQARTRPSR